MSIGEISGAASAGSSAASASASTATTTTTTTNPDGTVTTTVYNADGSVKSRTTSGTPKDEAAQSSTSAARSEGTGTLLDVTA